MSGEIEVLETPNWLKELEAKREKRVKARLGHEAGAGAPCLKCGDKCPGLDLHFWRKCCKNCKCPKEEHEVQDDDIYGWAQFQLLGSKPNKIQRKILLPGKNDEIDLEWVPKGHNETIDKYLKTLPPDQLPVKGSQAAQDRKQLLQKQIPIHDIDPSLCHDLTEDELKKMNEYISHVKQASAGVGQIVSLSSIIKGKLHMLNPADAAIIASRYAKGIPVSEIVKLQGQNKTGILGQSLEKMNLGSKDLPQFIPNVLNQREDVTNPMFSTKIHDKEYPMYSSDVNRSTPNAQFSKQLKNSPNYDPRHTQNSNFDSKNRPAPYNPKSPIEFNSETSAFVPYQKISTVPQTGDVYVENNSSVNNPNFAEYLGQNRNYLPDEQIYENIKDLKKSPSHVPNYASSKFNTFSDVQNPTKIPKNVKDLAFSTYEPGKTDPNELLDRNNGFKIGKYRQPGSYNENSSGFRPIEAGNYSTTALPHQHQPLKPNPESRPGYQFTNVPNAEYASGLKPGYNRDPTSLEGLRSGTGSLDKTSGYPGGIHFPNTSELDPVTGQRTGSLSGYNPNQYSGDPSNKYGRNIDPNSSSFGNRTGEFRGDQKPDEINLPKNYAYLKDGEIAENFIGIAPNKHNEDLSQKYVYNIDPNQKYGHNIDPSQKYGHNIDPLKKYGHNIDPVNRSKEFIVDQKPDGTHIPNTGYLEDGKTTENLAGYTPNQYKRLPGYNTEGSGMNVPQDVPLGSGEIRGRYPGSSLEESIGDRYVNSRDATDPKYGPNISGYGQDPSSPMKSAKHLSELHPNDLRISEDFLNPSQVNIGLIQDINYPDIKTATQETGDFYEEYSPDSIKEILNNVKLPDCHYCKKPFEENEFAVSIDRANVLFHAGCFKCAGCNQILADNVYFYNKETDNIYCLRDYAKIRGFPRCKACDELIFTKEYCLAENSTFHLKHFCCTECDMPLAGQDYTLEDEMPYCLPCFEQNKASKCSSCGRVIKPDEVGCNMKGIHFHADDSCFACKVCKTPLMGKKLLLRNDKLYCSHECFGADQ